MYFIMLHYNNICLFYINFHGAFICILYSTIDYNCINKYIVLYKSIKNYMYIVLQYVSRFSTTDVTLRPLVVIPSVSGSYQRPMSRWSVALNSNTFVRLLPPYAGGVRQLDDEAFG